MKLWSPAWSNGEAMPERFAAGRLAADGGVEFADNLSPPLAWSDLPPGTRSLALVCHDFDAPSSAVDVNQPGREVPADLPRVDFFHWLLVDLPPDCGGFDEGRWSRGFTPRGKTAQPGVARQGLNDYTGWFAGDAALAGRYVGYDGPFPPFNDSLVHHYLFALYALDVARLAVEGDFGGAQVREALAGHVLGAATLSGTYTLNRRLRSLP
ncbi:MAG TPA: YbhB/YbcL family Raf kinase inhibitor-like protein [Aquabacterium sp.]|nr:YbhB/YbcL family Raf kinase inhibitor-like protein [Aquabacterium sp.]HQC96529.1 YbhB/YbcL family Raf kinase inhibitor-like protein [Aquabacterium sp.]